MRNRPSIKSVRWPKRAARRRLIACTSALLLWPLAAIALSAALNESGIRRFRAVSGSPLPGVDLEYRWQDGIAEFAFWPSGQLEEDGDLFIPPRSSVRYAAIGPFPTRRTVTATFAFGDRMTPGQKPGAVQLTLSEIEALLPHLREWLRKQQHPVRRQWAKPGMLQQPARSEMLWLGHFLNGSIIIVPVGLLLAAPPLMFFIRRRRRLQSGHCPRCAYDLSATPGPTCTECGGSNPFAAC